MEKEMREINKMQTILSTRLRVIIIAPSKRNSFSIILTRKFVVYLELGHQHQSELVQQP